MLRACAGRDWRSKRDKAILWLLESVAPPAGVPSGQPRRGGLPRRDAAVIAQFHEHPEGRLGHIDERLGHSEGAQRTKTTAVDDCSVSLVDGKPPTTTGTGRRDFDQTYRRTPPG